MEFVKRVIPGNYDSVFYSQKGAIVNPADWVLLGFKDNLPVLSSRMDSRKANDVVGKTVKVEVDPQTGEKYIQLNGKKLKMVTKSEVPPRFKTNALLGAKSVKVETLSGATKVIKNADLDKTTCTLNVNRNLKDRSHADNDLSQKHMLISNCKIPVVKNPIANSPICQSASAKEDINFAIIVNNLGVTKTYTYRPNDMKTVSLKRTTEKVDKSVQTEVNTLVSQHVQTDVEELSNLSSLDLLDWLTKDFPASPVAPTPPDVEPNGKLADMRKVQLFFNDLKTALQPDDKGNMPIHIGVLRNDLNYVKRCCNILKALQKPVDIFNHGDMTALQLAILNDINPEIIKTLLQYGASLDVTDSEDNNILHLAVEHERKEVLLIILESADATGFDLNQFNAEGLTPLMMCCLGNEFYECAEILLQHSADVNVRDRKSGRTALFHAAENHDVTMVHLLLNYKADTKIKNFFGTSPHDAMYEVDDMPDEIKKEILGRSLKRKVVEEPKILKTILKTRRVDEVKPLKTYARFKKINDYDFQKNVTAK